ncbi:MAG: enoyl-CoA hydratase-related protein [Betaproteobacteria bacterium]
MHDYSKYQYLKVSVENKLATVTLNRPEKHNALNREFIAELRSIWLDVGEDESVNAILVNANGKYFSVGGDVKAMADRPGGDFLAEGESHDPARGRRLVQNLLSIDKPIVCAIHGDAIGLAATVALMCDITVISQTARVGDPHVRIGLVAGDGGAAIWPLLVGVSRAKEYLMRGTLINGVEAERIGLVNHVVPADQVQAKVKEIAMELAQGATWAIRGTKASVNLMLKQMVGLTMETSMALEVNTMHTEDHREATRAFAEKRKPNYTGR